MALNARAASILDFEANWWSRAGSKEQAIRRDLALSPTRYYQLLNDLVDSAEALAYDPLVVKRVRRDRDRRRRARFEGAGSSR